MSQSPIIPTDDHNPATHDDGDENCPCPWCCHKRNNAPRDSHRMFRCMGKRKDGVNCKRKILDSYGFCHLHSETCRLQAWKRKLERIGRRLDELLLEVRKDYPNAQWYVAEGGLHLMSDESHRAEGDKNDDPHYERILASYDVRCIDSGAW